MSERYPQTSDSNKHPKISVIIPCKQAERTLDVCLRSLTEQSYPAAEIIVVNDGSTDRTAEIAKAFPVVLMETTGSTGAAAARKVGAEKAKGDIIAFLDSDCEAPKDWLEKIRHNLAADPELGAVGGGYTHPKMGSIFGKLVALEEEYCHHQFALNADTANPPGGNFAIRREIWKRLRTSRELYYFRGMASGEDSVLSEELRQFTKVRFDAGMAVCHHTNEASRYFVRHMNRGRSRMSIRLYRLVSPRDNEMTMDAYGGMKMVWASFAMLAGIASAGLTPFVGTPALALSLLFLGLHFTFSHKYFSFAQNYFNGARSKDRLNLFENLALRIALAVRLCCWAAGALWAIKRYVFQQSEKWWNIAMSIAHFWRSSRVSKLFFFVTSKCNARCSFCFNLDNVVNWDKRKHLELSLDEITQIAKNFGRLPYITLSGGEPFIRNDLVEVIEAFYKHSHTQWVTIPSNAALTSVSLEKTIQILNRCPNLFLTVQASIDSLDADHNESRNIRDGFQKMSDTLRGWAWLCQFYPNLRIQLATCYDDFNRDRIEEIIQYCRENFNFHKQILYLIRDAHTTITQSNNHLMPSFFDLIDSIDEYESKEKSQKNGLWHRTVNVFQRQVSNDLFSIKRDKKFLRPCYATQKFFTLYDDGQVSPCEVLDKTNLGNLRNHNLDYYELKRAQNVDGYYRKTIRDDKCNCDWTCAIPINMLYDVKSLASLASGFVVTKPLEAQKGRQDLEQIQPSARTYNQSEETWDKVQSERSRSEDYVLQKQSRSQPPAPPPA